MSKRPCQSPTPDPTLVKVPKLEPPQQVMLQQKLPNEILIMIVEYVLEPDVEPPRTLCVLDSDDEEDTDTDTDSSSLGFPCAGSEDYYYYLFPPEIFDIARVSRFFLVLSMQHLVRAMRIVEGTRDEDCIELDAIQGMFQSTMKAFGKILGVEDDEEYWDGVLGLSDYYTPEVGLAEEVMKEEEDGSDSE